MSSNEDRLIELVGRFGRDPLGYARVAYPWGEGELSGSVGPRAWQADVLDTIGRHLRSTDRCKPLMISVASGHGVGKLHGYDTIVPVPGGERRWGDLGVGDFVFGSDGSAVRIIGTRHYRDVPMYRVTFDDGSFCEVSSGHLWNVRGRGQRRNGIDGYRTLETIEILERGVRRPNGVCMARQWEVPVQGMARFEEREIDLHPYFVGLWLSDGTKCKPCYTKPFPEITEKMRALGYSVATSDDNTFRVLGISPFFTDAVFGLGSHDRYIPDDYKYNTVENRMALFCGLMDGDGEVHGSGSIGYSTTSKRLADDVMWLARSLGCKAMLQNSVKKGWYPVDGGRVDCRDCYRVTINAPFNPFTLRHRKERYKPSEHRYLVRWIDSIERIERGDGMCIEVEASDGLYLANDFIVTHNSALVGMITGWGMSTMIDSNIVVTANTETQLRTKTWPEISKWLRSSINAHWFKATATAVYALADDHDRTWRADAIPWSENNTEAFAGLHNQGRRIILIFDEASSISDKVWEVAEGAMTDADTEIIWLAFGNPTRNSGRFRECFGRFKHRWIHRQIDSRTVEGTNKAQIQAWVDDYGEDSDFVRVRVKGEFPRAGTMQFIASDVASAAMDRVPVAHLNDPLVMGVDVARFGDDQTVIVIRRGRDAVSIPWVTMRGADTMEVAARIMELANLHHPDVIFVDGGGVGGGVVDRLRMLRQNVIEVQFGGKADRSTMTSEGDIVYANKRAEMWGYMRDWLKGGMIPSSPDLLSELTGVEYGYIVRDGRDAILLEKKADMKKRGLSSPDLADALAITFAYPVVPTDHSNQLRGRATHQISYDPLSLAHVRQDVGSQSSYDPLSLDYIRKN